jgi:hypothetical protein
LVSGRPRSPSWKKKFDPAADEAQHGARAAILEEAVTAIVFARAKKLAVFDGKRFPSLETGTLWLKRTPIRSS